MAGWFGSADDALFEMPAKMRPAADAGRLQLGTPHVLSLAPLLGSLDVLNAAGINRLRARSLDLTRSFIEAFHDRLQSRGFALATPADDTRRGGHVALRYPAAERIVAELAARNVVVDYRRPDLIRVAPVAAYNTHEEVDRCVQSLIEASP